MGLRESLIRLGINAGTGFLTGGPVGAGIAAAKFGSSLLTGEAHSEMKPAKAGHGFRPAALAVIQAHQAAMEPEAFADWIRMQLAIAEVVQAHLNQVAQKSPGQIAYETWSERYDAPTDVWGDLSEGTRSAWEHRAQQAPNEHGGSGPEILRCLRLHPRPGGRLQTDHGSQRLRGHDLGGDLPALASGLGGVGS